MERFIKEYRKINTTHSRQQAITIYKILQKDRLQLKKQELKHKKENDKLKESLDASAPPSITLVPSLETPTLPIVERQEQELQDYEEQPESEYESEDEIEQEHEKESQLELKLKAKHVLSLVQYWERELERIINGNAVPRFPSSPSFELISKGILQRLATPVDIYSILEKYFYESSDQIQDTSCISLLVLLASDYQFVNQVYNEYKVNSCMASNKIKLFLNKQGTLFNGQWEKQVLPILRKDYLEYCIKYFTEKGYNRTIGLTIDNKEFKDFLLEINSLKDLFSALQSSPHKLLSIPDCELAFYDLTPNEILQVRRIFAIKQKSERQKQLESTFTIVYPPPVAKPIKAVQTSTEKPRKKSIGRFALV